MSAIKELLRALPQDIEDADADDASSDDVSSRDSWRTVEAGGGGGGAHSSGFFELANIHGSANTCDNIWLRVCVCALNLSQELRVKRRRRRRGGAGAQRRRREQRQDRRRRLGDSGVSVVGDGSRNRPSRADPATSESTHVTGGPGRRDFAGKGGRNDDGGGSSSHGADRVAVGSSSGGSGSSIDRRAWNGGSSASVRRLAAPGFSNQGHRRQRAACRQEQQLFPPRTTPAGEAAGNIYCDRGASSSGWLHERRSRSRGR